MLVGLTTSCFQCHTDTISFSIDHIKSIVFAALKRFFFFNYQHSFHIPSITVTYTTVHTRRRMIVTY